MSGVNCECVRGESSRPVLETDPLRVALFFLHTAIIAYVCVGWTVHSRWGLLVYLLLLPLMMLQWLFNGGSSVVNNVESRWRTGSWRDPEGNGLEGVFFQTALNTFGVRASQAQINTVLVSVLSLLWLTAMFRMVLIPTGG